MTRTWWGEFEVDEGATRLWEIGPYRLWATRLREEWQLTTEAGDDGLSSALSIATEPTEPPGEDATSVRLGFRTAPPTIRLLPATADRPVIVKAVAPFLVSPGEEISLFVSTPLWIQVGTGRSSEALHEAPLYRPTDTWFGPSPREGELCYAARTAARYQLENVPYRPHRATSVVRIRNRSQSQLGLERIKLPLPYLSIFASESGRLWTESLTLERETEDENASIKLSRGAPKVAGETKRVASPRQQAETGLLTRTFGSLFGRKGRESLERVGD